MTDIEAEILPWDSAFFGCTVARAGGRLDAARADGLVAWCRAAGVDWLYFLAVADDPATVRVAQAKGFDLVDIRLELEAEVTHTAPAHVPGFVLRLATEADEESLVAIAAEVHSNSRFFADSRVPRDRARELYATWIRRSRRGELADAVLVAESEGRASAYITGAVEAPGHGSIGLLGVGPAARNRGVAQVLVNGMLQHLCNRGVRLVSVVTQGQNIAAQRVYQRCGFLTRSVKLWYHRWFT